MAYRQPVSPARAMAESSLRTAVTMLVGAGLTALAGWAATQGFDLKISNDMKLVVGGLVWSVLSVAYAAVQRKFWPIQTDALGVGRTDVTSGGRVV